MTTFEGVSALSWFCWCVWFIHRSEARCGLKGVVALGVPCSRYKKLACGYMCSVGFGMENRSLAHILVVDAGDMEVRVSNTIRKNE